MQERSSNYRSNYNQRLSKEKINAIDKRNSKELSGILMMIDDNVLNEDILPVLTSGKTSRNYNDSGPAKPSNGYKSKRRLIQVVSIQLTL